MIRFALLILFCAVFCPSSSGQITVEVIQPIEVTVQESFEEFTVVMCTAKYCKPCRIFKASDEYKRIGRRFKIEVADIEELPEWKRFAPRVPYVWLIRKSDRKMLKSWEGVVTLSILIEEAKRQTAELSKQSPKP